MTRQRTATLTPIGKLQVLRRLHRDRCQDGAFCRECQLFDDVIEELVAAPWKQLDQRTPNIGRLQS